MTDIEKIAQLETANETLSKIVEKLQSEKDVLLEGLEKLGWPVRLVELPEYCGKLTSEIERLQKELDRHNPDTRI